MSARIATGLALVTLLASSSIPRAEAAPRSGPAPKSAARRATRPLGARPVPAPSHAPAPAPGPLAPPAPAPAPPPAPAPALDLSTPDRDHVSPAPSALHHRGTVTLNPLALVVGRYGANAEVVLAPHHAITASAYYQTFPSGLIRMALPDASKGAAPQSRLGGELGYRLYTGSDGPTGFFVGPSFVAMPLAAPRLTDAYEGEVVSFMAYGASLDLGVQAVVGPGFTLGAGLGVMALAYDSPASATPPPGIELPSHPEPHVLPRLLVMAGWAF